VNGRDGALFALTATAAYMDFDIGNPENKNKISNFISQEIKPD